ncbi:hypothetical protein MKX03_027624 [Papaver bracteatum]|nr:hypothetical protein MKX03_027624 [Papaver bracteatum]
MEILRELLFLLDPIATVSIVVVIVSIVVLYNVFFLVTHKNTIKKAPKASGAWPLIETVYKKLGTMADKYGPAFNIRLGNQEILVLSDSEMVKKWFSIQNDKLFSNRTTPLVLKYIFNVPISVTFTPSGTYWREVRKITVQHLLSKQCLEAWKHSKIKEINASFSRLNELCSNNGTGKTTPIRMDNWLVDLIFNVFMSMFFGYQDGGKATITGDTASNREKYKTRIQEAFAFLLSSFAISDVFPCLEWVDRSRGLIRDSKHFRDDLNSIAGCLIEEHIRKRSQSISKSDKGVGDEQDFINVLLSIAEQQLPGDDPDLVIKTMILDTVSAGVDTVSKTLSWTLSLLLNHPQVLKTAKEEIDMHVGRDRHVEDSDIPRLVYINAIIKETMRLYPNLSLIDRYTSEECEVAGYHVPAGGRIILNLWKIQRDPSVWQNPLEFKPERFLSNDDNNNKVNMDFKGQKSELLPFGIGRRICAGMLSALQVMHLVVPRLIHGFDMKAVSADGKMDMTEIPGFVCAQVAPLEVMVTPRQ